MARNVSKIVSSVIGLVGFRGTEDQIRDKLTAIADDDNVEASFSRFEKDNSLDIGYVANLGMSGNTYLDFDIFVLKTREKEDGKRVLYITESTFIG